MDDLNAVRKDIAPTGKLRVSLNFGNKVLVQRDENSAPKGITPALGRELARRLELELQFLEFERAEESFQSAVTAITDVCFVANDPTRAAEISFTAPYVSIAGVYVVPTGSRFQTPADVDQPGVKVGVSQGSAYDLFLTREAKNLELVRIKGSDKVTSLITSGQVDVLAGVGQPMEAFVAATPGYRRLAEPFMEINQAMGLPNGRPVATAYLKRFVEDVKASGFVADVLRRNGQPDVAVARPYPV